MVEGGGRPFVTIGVPTYNRHGMLRETLDSILAQGFSDFEVIVGNDYTAEILTGDMIGIRDPRVRFVNHPRNLREVGNMNALLAQARGRYFTWIFDDDLYEPGFLQTAHDSLRDNGFPAAFFSSFRMLREGEVYRPAAPPPGETVLLSGRQFLRRYAATRPPQIASTCGIFDAATLRETVGGVEELCPSAIGVYCEYLFLVRLALLERIVFLDTPFYLFRVHAESWSEKPGELEKYLAAGRELVARSAEVLRHPSLVEDFGPNLLMVCEQHLYTIANRFPRVEIGAGNRGPGGLLRAFARYRREAAGVMRQFHRLGGGRDMATRLAALKLELHCYRTILLTMASFAYHSLGKAGGEPTAKVKAS